MMFVTFNPTLSNNKYSRSNCCPGKQTAFKQIVPEEVIRCAGNADNLMYKLHAKREPVNATTKALIIKARDMAKGETKLILNDILEEFWPARA